MSVIHIPKRPEIGFRQIAMLALLFASLLVIFFRLWYLQVVKASDLSERAATLRKNSVPHAAPRGLIEDRNGVLLAGVRSEWVVMAVPATIDKHPECLARLAKIIGGTPDKMAQKIQLSRTKSYLPVPVAAGVSPEVAARIVEDEDDLPGIDVDSQPLRYYPDATDFAHVLGYVWTPSDRDFARLAKLGIRPSEYVGKTGLEYVYERQLMGTPGRDTVELDAARKPLRVVQAEGPVPGDKLVLTLDSGLQKTAMRALQAVQSEDPTSGGAAVALDPNSGEVLCMASNPTFNADLFLQGISNSDYGTLTQDPMHPLFNRAIAGAYSPGSTFKIVDTLASAKAGTFDPGRIVYCPGYYKVGNRETKCLGHHGPMRYQAALERSCNTYFADLAVRTGENPIRDEALQVGLGRRCGIDLTGEGRAVVPTDDWLRAVLKLPKDEKPKWYTGDTVNLGIGQGELSVTPLQMADLASLVANDGFCYRPHLVKRIVPSDGGAAQPVSPEVVWKTQVDANVWADLKTAMQGVIEVGTGRRAQIPGVAWCGKTGSTEHSGPNKKTHSWFVGFAPADHPRIAIAVLVEQAGHGGDVAAPIAAAVVKQYLQEGGIIEKDPPVATP